MTTTSTIPEFGNLLVIVGLPLLAAIIGFLSYLRGHFNHLEKVRETKEREANQNREMYIKMVVQSTIEVEIKEIHNMLSELGKNVYCLIHYVSELGEYVLHEHIIAIVCNLIDLHVVQIRYQVSTPN